MAVDFLSLPQYIFDKICNFLSFKDFLRLKSVSKITDKRVSMLAISQKIPIHEFIVSQKNIEEGSESDGESDGEYNVELEIDFVDIVQEFFMWKLCFMYSLRKLGINYATILNHSSSSPLMVTARPKDIRRLLEFLKPFTGATDFEYVDFNNLLDYEVVSMCSSFLVDKSMRSLTVGQRIQTYSDCKAWSDFMNSVDVTNVQFSSVVLNKESVQFFFEIANRVREIGIVVYQDDLVMPGVEFVQKMLVNAIRKCNKLFYFNWHSLFSKADAENLLQAFHHEGFEGIVRFLTRDSYDIRIGEYQGIAGVTLASITHMDFASL